MLLRESRGFFSWLVILTVAWLEIIILWKILCSENIKNESDSCEQVKKRPFGHSGGLSDSAGPLVSKSCFHSLYKTYTNAN